MKIVFEYRFFHQCQEFVQCPFKPNWFQGLFKHFRCLAKLNWIFHCSHLALFFYILPIETLEQTHLSVNFFATKIKNKTTGNSIIGKRKK